MERRAALCVSVQRTSIPDAEILTIPPYPIGIGEGDPRYPFDLFCRIITVSLEKMKIVNALPRLDIREAAGA